MKTKLALLALVLVMVAATTATTFAIFSDSKQGTSTMTAGTLCIQAQRDQGNFIPGPMFYVTPGQGDAGNGADPNLATGVWAPGDQILRVLTLTNTCTLDAWTKTISASLNANNHSMADAQALAQYFTVKVEAPDQYNPSIYRTVAQGPLTQFLSAGGVTVLNPSAANGRLIYRKNGGNGPLNFTLTLDSHAPNSVQGKDLYVDFSVYAEQNAHQ